MRFYRIEDTELLESGVSQYTFFVPPEGLDSFLTMMSKYSEIHHLAEPVLIDLEVDLKTGKLILPEDLKNQYFIIV